MINNPILNQNPTQVKRALISVFDKTGVVELAQSLNGLSVEILSTGGRVLGITALGDNVAEAQKKAYDAIELIDWPSGFCRRDIGWRALSST